MAATLQRRRARAQELAGLAALQDPPRQAAAVAQAALKPVQEAAAEQPRPRLPEHLQQAHLLPARVERSPKPVRAALPPMASLGPA